MARLRRRRPGSVEGKLVAHVGDELVLQPKMGVVPVPLLDGHRVIAAAVAVAAVIISAVIAPAAEANADADVDVVVMGLGGRGGGRDAKPESGGGGKRETGLAEAGGLPSCWCFSAGRQRCCGSLYPHR